jgi:hypothetical protein
VLLRLLGSLVLWADRVVQKRQRGRQDGGGVEIGFVAGAFDDDQLGGRRPGGFHDGVVELDRTLVGDGAVMVTMSYRGSCRSPRRSPAIQLDAPQRPGRPPSSSRQPVAACRLGRGWSLERGRSFLLPPSAVATMRSTSAPSRDSFSTKAAARESSALRCDAST